jgi:hypothetical protein
VAADQPYMGSGGYHTRQLTTLVTNLAPHICGNFGLERLLIIDCYYILGINTISYARFKMVMSSLL